MSSSRLTLLPDEHFAPLLPSLQECLTSAANSITPENFTSIFDETMRRAVLVAFQQAGADEGAVWLADEPQKALVMAFNNGPDAEKLVAKYHQPLDRGIVSMVFSSEKSITENEMPKNAKQDKTVDRLMGKETLAMIAVPLYFLEGCRGVVSCVKLGVPGKKATESQSFPQTAQALLSHASTVLGRLLDLRVLRITLGLR